MPSIGKVFFPYTKLLKMHSFTYSRKCYYNLVAFIRKFEYQKVLQNLGHCASECIFVYRISKWFPLAVVIQHLNEDITVYMWNLYYSIGTIFKHSAIPLIKNILAFDKK